MTIQTGGNKFGVAQWIVSKTPGEGTHLTIQGAFNSASANEIVVVTEGVYTENLTPPDGISCVTMASYLQTITASQANNFYPVKIKGKISSSTEKYSFKGFLLETNGDYVLEINSNGIVQFNECFWNAVDNDLWNLSNSNFTNFNNCVFSFASTFDWGSATFSCNQYLNNCTTSSASTSVASLGYVNASNCQLVGFTCNSCLLTSCVIGGGPVTVNSTGAQINDCYINGIGFSSNPALVINGNALVTNCRIHSNNTSAIGGTGTITYGGLVFTGTSSLISTTTQIPLALTVQQGGTGLSATNINRILYSTANNVIGQLTTANGGVLTTDPSTGAPSIDTTNFVRLSTGMQVKGNNSNTAPPAGFIGQQIRGALAFGSAVSVTSSTSINIVSISLTAGIWDVSAIGEVICTSTTRFTSQNFGISTVSATMPPNPGDDSIYSNFFNPIVGFAPGMSIPSYRMTLSSTTTVYLVFNSQFSLSTCNAYGRISATRVG